MCIEPSISSSNQRCAHDLPLQRRTRKNGMTPAWLAILISRAAGGLGWGLPLVFLALHALVGWIAVAVELPSGKQQPVERSSPCSPSCWAACGSRGREKTDSLESARSVYFATSLAQLTRSANLCDRECLVNFRESAMSCVCYHSCRRRMPAVFSGRFSPTGKAPVASGICMIPAVRACSHGRSAGFSI